MPDATTTYYGWSYPTNGADASSWGTTLNGTIVDIDAALHALAITVVPASGGSYTGAVTFEAGATVAGLTATGALSLPSGSVSNAMLANMGGNAVKANLTGVAGPPADVSLSTLLAAMGVSGNTPAGWGSLPGSPGLLIQIGAVGVESNVEQVYNATFPTAFPNVCLGVVPGTNIATGSGAADMWAQTVDSTINRFGCGFQLQFAGGGSRSTNISQFTFIAIGY